MRMATFNSLFLSLLLAAIPSFAAGEGVEGVVMATKLNVRVRPGTKYTRVAQLKKDDKVTVLRHRDGWYEILAPANSEVWISSLFIENGLVAKLANLRSGASVANSSYRLAKPGERLQVLKTSESWTKVQPPKNLKAWVSAKFIYLTPENSAKLAEKSTPKKTAAAKTADGQKKKTKKGGKTNKTELLPFLDSEGKTASYEGNLLPLN
ncbi:MAG: SH3 domain-containing protein [Victivallales bacterium]|nr:SH3 domain-containing protein [Victivallales bacterium]